jgi:diguanylate cyclase (GGDEF)-like protein
MTVLTTIEDKLHGFAAGGVDYVSKPFQIEELLARVNTHLTIYQLQRELHTEIRNHQKTEAALRKANYELERLAVLDELTQVANRRRFDQYLQLQWQSTTPSTLSLLLCDIDYFKLYNDYYGHQRGDDCLHRIAQAINRAVGHASDLVARYGGEEFAVILPATDLAGALHVAEAIRSEIRTLGIAHAASPINSAVTISIGAANSTPVPAATPVALIHAADSALYAAKRQGRNCVICAMSQAPHVPYEPMSQM